jgi:hypothetical protein
VGDEGFGCGVRAGTTARVPWLDLRRAGHRRLLSLRGDSPTRPRRRPICDTRGACRAWCSSQPSNSRKCAPVNSSPGAGGR